MFWQFSVTELGVVLAQGATGGGDSGLPGQLFGSNWFLFGGLLLILWFVIIAPARRQQRELDTMLTSLKKNDQVRTSGGFLGRVVSVDKDQDLVVLKVDENKDVRMKVLRSSIVAVLSDKKDAKEKK